MSDKNADIDKLYETEIYYVNGRFDEKIYNEYIKQHLTTKDNNLINNMLNSYEAEDRYINYISIGLKSDMPCSYSELLLLELNNNESTYIPVFNLHINTSSLYSLMRTYTDNDDNDNDNADNDFDKSKSKSKMNLHDLKKLLKNYDSTRIINYVLQRL
jgi:hypothetical protein